MRLDKVQDIDIMELKQAFNDCEKKQKVSKVRKMDILTLDQVK